ncbi:MAG: LamG-like jellyroll fold domain-containing protein [Ignavibacteria bacterium]|nr:LamG-like jellyroll fold domain-containing protein [Ignavibacteria bacterium]
MYKFMILLFFSLTLVNRSFSQWIPQTSGTTNELHSVHFTDLNNGWTVGYNGTILRTTDSGINWTTQTSGTTNFLYSVYFTDLNKGWAVGEAGTILKTTDGGSNWATQTSGAAYDLYSVHFIDSDTGWTVGGYGKILKTTDGGSNWTLQVSGTTVWLSSIYFTNFKTGWAVGEVGTILKTTDGGSNWFSQTSGTTNHLYSSNFNDTATGWTVGQGGTILKTTDGGINWTAQISGTTNWLSSVHFIDTAIGWIVGDGGTILKTTNGGINWSAQMSGTINSLRQVYFTNTNAGWVVGYVGTILTYKATPSLSLSYPNGGEIFYSGSQQTITWNSSNVDAVNLYFSPDNGSTWNSIATNLPAYMGSYSSIVSSASTNNALIRMSDASDAATFDESDGVFTIIDTTKHKITISLPNGGENWQVGSNQYLAWTNTSMTGSVNIDYSTDNGTTWLSVATNLPSMYPTYMWTIPNTPSTTCKIKVYDASDTSVFDESDAVFTIQRLEQFTEQTSISLLGLGLSSVAWGDYNNDGYLDILLTGRNDASHPFTIIYKNNGDGTFTEQTDAALTSASSGSAAWGDYDNDGYLDIFLTGYTISGPISQIYKNNGDGTFTLLTSVSLPGVGNSSVAWGDYDNDGKLDILLTGNSFGARISKIFKNNGNGIFTEQTSVSLTGVSNSSVAWGDYDNDGNLDILLTGLNDVSGQVSIIYKNNGDGTFTEQTSVFLAGVEQGSIAWGDYDNDGYLDILLTGMNGTNQISKIYKNNGNGTFTEQTSASLTGVSNSSVAWGDYNNDGSLDILLTGYEINNNPISKIYKNMGEGIFDEQTSASLIGVGNSSVVWGDYDNDGALDILLTGYAIGSGYISKIYKNINAVFNTASSAPTNLTSSVSGKDVSFNWNKSFDQETPQNGLSYNLLIGTTLESVDVLSPMANKTNGFRRIVKPGNNQTNSWTIKNLPGGTYLWSVQAIDAAFTGSPFASQEVFTVGEITNTLSLLSPNGGEFLVAGTTDTIHWSANYLTQVKLDYTTDGSTWTNIVGSMPAEYPSGFAWVVPNTPSTFCKVRVTDINDTIMADESDGVFTINSDNGIDSITYGGKIYHTVKIGTQTWLKENLDIGTMILGTENLSNNSIMEKYCYDNNPMNCDTYGGLYQWNEAMQYATTLGTQGICPTGWHIPTNQEFDTLAVFVNNDGNALKAEGEGTGVGMGTNMSGFTALLAGDFYDYTRIFKDIGSTGNFWTSNSGPFIFYVNSSDAFAGLSVSGAANENYGFSVRCLKDESPITTIRIFSPNGGEYLVSGTVDTIRWSANSTTQIKIDYTTDDGGTWENIAGGIYSIYPAYAWTVPYTASTTCRVRVTDNNNPAMFDESDSAFTIQLFKSGEYVPDANTILLDHFNGTTDASILAYSPTGQPCGSEWPSVAPSYFFNPGMNELYQALTLNPPIEEVQGSATYLKYPGGQLLSQANGTIEFWIRLSSYGKGLSFVNQGQYFGACYGWTFNLDMDSTGMLNSSAWAAFSLNSGDNKVPLGRWTHLAVTWGSTGAKMYIDGNLVGSDGNTGMPAYGYGGNVLITLGTGAGVSASIDELRISNIQRTEFHIIPQMFLTVQSPNGGENLVAGAIDTIRWTSSNATTLNIEYSTDNGENWISIYPAMPSGIGSAPWLIPNTPSTNCKVKVTDNNNPDVFDVSDNVFTIAPQMFTDLVAYYPFMDGSLADFSGNGNAASNFGAQLVADRFGNPNNAYYFNGEAYMSVPNSPSLQSPTNMVTLSGWIKTDIGSIYAIAVKSITSAMGQYRLYITDNSVVFSSSLIFDVGMPFTFEHEKWYFVAVSWDGNNINYFVNGNFIGSAPSAGTLTPDTEPLVWGMDTPGLTEFTNGTLDDIRIYNRALPTTEIRALYHEGGWDMQTVDSGLVAYYPFNNNTIDESGNGNNGTNNGAVPTFDRFNNPNSALSFDGNSNFVLVPSSTSLNVQNSITLSAWIKTDNPHIIQDVNPGSIIAKHETVQTRQYDLFFYNDQLYDSIFFHVVDQRDSYSPPYDEYIYPTGTPSASYRNNQWHMVVGTYDYNTGFSQIYIDGVLTTAKYIGQIDLMKSNVPLTIGCYSEQNSNFRGFYQGVIDDIRIYDRALSQEEISMLYYEKEYIPSSLTLLTPVGGEVLHGNSEVPIEWSASNIQAFRLEYTSDDGANWTLITDTLSNSTPGFLWTVPDIESEIARIRISDKNNPNLFDESDSNFTITNRITQSVPLYYSGWNMISFYAQPVSSLPRDVFPSPPVLQVKTELQTFDPSLPEFLNTLKNVTAAQGYLVKVDDAETYFQIKGNHFYPADGINYRAGWNLISYYYSYGESVWYAFEPIMTSVEEIKTLTSYYNPLGSPETNTLYTLEPGEAYWLRLKNNIDGYVLPSPQAIMPKKHQTIGQKLMADLPWKLKGYTQSTVAIFTVTSNGRPVPSGSVVAAFINNECRAISEVKLNPEGTAFATLVINGDKEEEASFKIFDAEIKEAFGSNLKLKTKPGTTIAGIQELPFTFITGIEDPILPTTTDLMNAYPNPFNPETRIRYSLNTNQHVSLMVYDILGKEVMTLVNETKEPGYYEVSFNASSLPSGIYFYRMQAGEFVSVKKLLLLK